MSSWSNAEPGYADGARGTRLAGAGGALIATAALLAMLWAGLAMRQSIVPVDAISVFDVGPLVVPPPLEIPSVAPRPRSAAAPAHRVARPVPIEAPVPIVRIDPPAMRAAPIAAAGADPAAGAAAAGTGTGGGGVGNGPGAGSGGHGSGGGATIAARHILGTIDNGDYPKAARRAGQRGIVIVTLRIGADGAVTGCDVAQSSGVAALDETTCRLARVRFRYHPARDAAGRAVPSLAGWRQDWWFAPR